MNLTPSPPTRFWQSRYGVFLVRYLDNWKPWVVILAAGLIAVNVWTLTIYRVQSRDEAAHSATVLANANGQYHACVASIPLLTKLNGFIAGDQIVRDTLVKNARAILAVTPRSDPTYTAKVANLTRLVIARSQAFQIQFPVPTLASCQALRERLLGH